MDSIKEQRKAFNRAYNEREAVYQALIQKAGMSEVAYRILYAVCEGPEKWSQIDICREWNYPKQSVNTAIAKLVKQGIVTLVSDKTAPRNRKIVNLTPLGASFCEQWVRPVISADVTAFGTLSYEERNCYVEMIQRQCKSLKESVKNLLEAE